MNVLLFVFLKVLKLYEDRVKFQWTLFYFLFFFEFRKMRSLLGFRV